MRFLVDENLPAGVATMLRDIGHDVLDVADSQHRGEPDDALWQLAIDEQRIVVTCDLGFPFPAMPVRPPGIVVVRPQPTMGRREIERLVEQAFTQIGVDALAGNVTVVEPGRVRQRPYGAL